MAGHKYKHKHYKHSGNGRYFSVGRHTQRLVHGHRRGGEHAMPSHYYRTPPSNYHRTPSSTYYHRAPRSTASVSQYCPVLCETLAKLRPHEPCKCKIGHHAHTPYIKACSMNLSSQTYGAQKKTCLKMYEKHW